MAYRVTVLKWVIGFGVVNGGGAFRCCMVLPAITSVSEVMRRMGGTTFRVSCASLCLSHVSVSSEWAAEGVPIGLERVNDLQ